MKRKKYYVGITKGYKFVDDIQTDFFVDVANDLLENFKCKVNACVYNIYIGENCVGVNILFTKTTNNWFVKKITEALFIFYLDVIHMVSRFI